MFRRFSSLVDPFQSYAQNTPPENAWRFLVQNLWPFRYVTAMSLMLTVIGAAIEVWLIGYASELVDALAAAPPAACSGPNHGHELLIAGAIVLVARPLAGLLKESLDDIAFRPNAEYLVRWRAHRHVLGQSVGWFRNDLAGRIAAQVRDSARPVPALPIVSCTRCPSSRSTSRLGLADGVDRCVADDPAADLGRLLCRADGLFAFRGSARHPSVIRRRSRR